MTSTHSKIYFPLLSLCLFCLIAGAWASDMPNLGRSSPSVCDEFYSCPEKSTCCCVYESSGSCYSWGCCALEGATCCEDHNSCCPREYPVCNVSAGTCSISKDNPLGVTAMKRILAQPVGSFGKKGKTSCA